MQVYNLNKTETEKISEQLAMISHYQKLVESLQSHLRSIFKEVVDKTDIPEENKDFVVFDLNQGTFSVQRPEEKETKNPVPKKS